MEITLPPNHLLPLKEICKWQLFILACIIFISPFTYQHLRTIQCVLDHILITAPTHFGVHWHHLQAVPFNCKFFNTSQHLLVAHYMITDFHTECKTLKLCIGATINMWFSIHIGAKMLVNKRRYNNCLVWKRAKFPSSKSSVHHAHQCCVHIREVLTVLRVS